jgi:hypothetical protein
MSCEKLYNSEHDISLGKIIIIAERVESPYSTVA